MKSTDNVGIAFANLVVALGRFNHVVNVTFAAFQWSPNEDKVEPDPAITCRLRMDEACAEQLWKMLGKSLGKNVEDDPPPAGLAQAERQPGEAVN